MSTQNTETQTARFGLAVPLAIGIDLDLRDLEIGEEEILTDLLYPDSGPGRL